MIKIKNLTKKFNSQKVIDDISLEINDGECFAIIGPSGCGKSTLLRLLIRLQDPTAGTIEMDNQDIAKLNEEGLVKLRQRIGMVFQSSALFDSMTVFENVAFALKEHSTYTKSEIKKIVSSKLEKVGLGGKEALQPSELSGGMQKRVSIARALAFNPKIVLYDEPTTGLDPLTSVTIENLINKIAKEDKATSIIVTHQLSTIFRTANRIVMMNQGKLIEVGGVEQARKSHNPIVSEFIKAGEV